MARQAAEWRVLAWQARNNRAAAGARPGAPLTEAARQPPPWGVGQLMQHQQLLVAQSTFPSHI